MTLELYWIQNCPYYNSRVVIYDRKMFIRLATGSVCRKKEGHNECKNSLNGKNLDLALIFE